MSFGKKLKMLREENHMSQEQLADLLNLSRSTIAGYETKKNREPSHEKMVKIADIFHVSIDFLINDNVISIEPSNSHHPLKTEEELFLLEKYRRLSAKSRTKVLDYIQLLDFKESKQS